MLSKRIHLLGTIWLVVVISLVLTYLTGPLHTVKAINPTLVVTSETIGADAIPGDGICATVASECTLQAAIEEANALAGEDRIEFANGLQNIVIQDLVINDTDPLTIDGNGSVSLLPTPSTTFGLRLESHNNVIQGIEMAEFFVAIIVDGNENQIGLLIGDGMVTLRENSTGIRVIGASSNNRVENTRIVDNQQGLEVRSISVTNLTIDSSEFNNNNFAIIHPGGSGTISNNLLVDNQENMRLSAGSFNVLDNEIVGNSEGIVLTDFHDTTIQNNQIQTTSTALAIDNNINTQAIHIIDNILIYGPDSAGITLTNAGTVDLVDNHIAVDSTVFSARAGIEIVDASVAGRITATGNTINGHGIAENGIVAQDIVFNGSLYLEENTILGHRSAKYPNT